MALLQCRKFFRAYPHIQLIEDTDTADVAKRNEEEKLKGVGAIASSRAAAIYNLEILASEIQTIKDNHTRFVIVEKKTNNHQITLNKGVFEVCSKRYKWVAWRSADGIGKAQSELVKNSIITNY